MMQDFGGTVRNFLYGYAAIMFYILVHGLTLVGPIWVIGYWLGFTGFESTVIMGLNSLFMLHLLNDG